MQVVDSGLSLARYRGSHLLERGVDAGRNKNE